MKDKESEKKETIMNQTHGGKGDIIGGNKYNIFYGLKNKDKKLLFLVLISILIIVFVGVLSNWEPRAKEIGSFEIIGLDNRALEGAAIIGKKDSVEQKITIVDDKGQGSIPEDIFDEDYYDEIYIKFGGEKFDFWSDSMPSPFKRSGYLLIELDTLLSDFQVEYMNLEGFSLDFLIEGEISNGGDAVTKDVVILKTLPFEELVDYKRTFNKDADFHGYEKFRGKKSMVSYQEYPIEDSMEEPEPLNPGEDVFITPRSIGATYGMGQAARNFMIGTGAGIEEFNRRFDDQPIFTRFTLDSALNMIRGDTSWKFGELNGLLLTDSIIASNRFRKRAKELMHFRFARKHLKYEDFLQLKSEFYFQEKIYERLLDYLASNGYPEGFLVLDMKFAPELQCGNIPYEIDYFYVQMDLFLPLIKFQVCVIENLTNEVVSIEKIEIKERNESEVRTLFADQIYFESINEVKTIPFPRRTLKPNEKLVIPLFMYLQHQYKDLSGFPNEAYIKGTSISIEGIYSNGFKYPIRKYNPSYTYISGGYDGMGSCPFAFTYSKEESKWLLENHILYGYNHKVKEGFDTIELKRFDGRLLIKELDPEESFIDFIKIVIESNQKIYELHPNNSQLIQADNNYFIMNQGDEVLLNFPDWSASKKMGKILLISKGYYEPYSTRKKELLFEQHK